MSRRRRLGGRRSARLFAVLRTIAAKGAGIVLITHHLAEVFAMSDELTCLREGEVVLQTPDHGDEYDRSHRRDARPPSIGRPAPACSTARAADAPTQRRQTSRRSEIDTVAHRSKTHASGSQARRMCRLTPFRGEVLGIVGLAGSGRTTLAARAVRRRPPERRRNCASAANATDRIRPRTRCRDGFFLIPEDRGVHGLMLAKSIAENIALVILRRLISDLRLSPVLRGGARARAI